MPPVTSTLPPAVSAVSGQRRTSAAFRGKIFGRKVCEWKTLSCAILAISAIAADGGCRKAEAPKPSPSVDASGPARKGPLPAARAASGGYLFTSAESGAVDEFLRRNPNLRPATDADRKPGADSDAELRSLYGIYHPYFVRGDLNDDGALDFVLAFVRRDLGRGTPWFSIVVFTGRPASGASPEFSSGLFVERDVTLTRGDISVDRDSIVVSPDLDDETVRRYRWNPPTHTYVFVPDGDDTPDRPPVSQTSRSANPGSPPVRF